MRAAYFDRYGPPQVLRVAELPRPVPQPGELLVRVHASTANQTDCHARRASSLPWRLLQGLRQPRANRRIPGSEFAGVVEELGEGVTRFATGDRVFGTRLGANAEFLCVREDRLVAPMPANVTFEEAAAVCDGFFQALRHLRKARVANGTRLMVYGASGSCGTAAVQLAKHLGAHVTAVCTAESTSLVRSLGADEVLDYQKDDFIHGAGTFDVLLDAVGKLSYFETRDAVRPGGLWVATDGMLNILHAFWTPWFGKKRLVSAGPQRPTPEDLALLQALMESGRYRAVIDRVYPLESIAEAHRFVDSWEKKGNVVVSLVPTEAQ